MSTKIIVIFVDKSLMRNPVSIMLEMVGAHISPWRYLIHRSNQQWFDVHRGWRDSTVFARVNIGDVIIIKDNKYILPR